MHRPSGKQLRDSYDPQSGVRAAARRSAGRRFSAFNRSGCARPKIEPLSSWSIDSPWLPRACAKLLNGSKARRPGLQDSPCARHPVGELAVNQMASDFEGSQVSWPSLRTVQVSDKSWRRAFKAVGVRLRRASVSSKFCFSHLSSRADGDLQGKIVLGLFRQRGNGRYEGEANAASSPVTLQTANYLPNCVALV